MSTLQDVVAAAERHWPLATAEDWDHPGLTVGRPDQPVRRILLAVDPLDPTIREATDGGYDLLITHHPLLLRGVHTLAANTAKGDLIHRLIEHQCAHLSAHTNADLVENGTSGLLAQRLGLTDTQPLETRPGIPGGIGRVGTLPAPLTIGQLAQRVADLIPDTVPGVYATGDQATPVRRVSLCGGAGDSLLGNPHVQASDVYITADLRHHPATDFLQQTRVSGTGTQLIGVTHWASESLWLEAAAGQLAADLPDVSLTISTTRTDPWAAAYHRTTAADAPTPTKEHP